MLGWSSKMLGLTAEHWVCLMALGGMSAAFGRMVRQSREHMEEQRRERRLREEMEAYARLDVRMPLDQHGESDLRELGKRVCRTVAEKSVFRKVALLTRDADGRLYVASSTGMDDLTVEALNRWGERVGKADHRQAAEGRKSRLGVELSQRRKSFVVELRLGEEIERGPQQVEMEEDCRSMVVTPLWTTAGKMAGALVVCTEGVKVPHARAEEAMTPLETLAVKLARTMENMALAERLLRSEKLAGLGQMAGGVAHALNNPLTAVLGFAELIQATTDEPRVKQDAETIVQEAMKMRGTVQNLVNFWRPAAQHDEPVEVMSLLRELAADCAGKLESRGVKLEVEADDPVPTVRGDRARLRQVLEHLLNNSAQAIGMVQAGVGSGSKGLSAGEKHAIRLTVSHDARALHVVVSDTGPGFREPARVFDPFYATQQPGVGAGLGLSICYGIVREHGGEISAFNLHPHGAAVVVELPVGDTVVREVA